MSLTISQSNLVNAISYEAWSICLWGNPKMTVICGGCESEFKTRSYYAYNRAGHDPACGEAVVANCPRCGKWNRLRGIVMDD